MALHERLAALRALVPRLSNAELDRLCGLRKGHTRAIETNPEANPTVETTQKIATVLGATVGYLASGEGEPPLAADVAAAVERARKKTGGEQEAPADAEATFQHPDSATGTDGVR